MTGESLTSREVDNQPMTKPKRPFSPTKRCPHRLCRTLHSTIVLTSLVGLGPLLWNAGWSYLIFTALTMVIGSQAGKLAWKGRSMVDRAMDEAVGEGAGSAGNMSSRHLIVRPVWANIAAGVDMIAAMFGGGVAWRDVHGTADYSTPTGGADVFIVIAFVVVFLWFWEFAHRKATEPAKPLRLPVFVKAQQPEA